MMRRKEQRKAEVEVLRLACADGGCRVEELYVASSSRHEYEVVHSRCKDCGRGWAWRRPRSEKV